MDPRAIRTSIWIWLTTVTAFVLWFDYAAVTALLHPMTGPTGTFVFAVPGYSNRVLPFTYVAVAASLLGIAYFVYRREEKDWGRGRALLVGLLVGNVASVGMIDCYEQVYIELGCGQPSTHAGCASWMAFYWGTPGAVAYTVTGLLLVLSVLPWCRRTNLPGVALLLGVSAASFGVWFVGGYASPPSGTALDYAMNAVSRLSSQLSLVAAVAPRDLLDDLQVRVRALWIRIAHAPIGTVD